jgi:hypothetical protein
MKLEGNSTGELFQQSLRKMYVIAHCAQMHLLLVLVLVFLIASVLLHYTIYIQPELCEKPTSSAAKNTDYEDWCYGGG